MNLQSLQPFTADAGAIETALARVAAVRPDLAVRRDRARPRGASPTRGPGDPHRRAVVVFTDGIDTSSLLKPEQVSAIASGIDVPVYVMTVVSQGERDREDAACRGEPAARRSRGGPGDNLFVTSAPAHESMAARQIVDELRHQYVLAFSASPRRAGAHWT